MMPTKPLRLLASFVFLALLAGCASQPAAPIKPTSCPPCPTCKVCEVCPTTAPPTAPPAKPLQAAHWNEVQNWPGEEPAAAWKPFLESCKHLQKQAIWKETCAAALALPAEEAADPARIKAFFEARLRPWQVVNPDDSREGLITGYYEPLLQGDRHRVGAARHPLYAPPDDMLTLDFGDLYPELKHMRLRGRVEGKKILPYWSRAELAERQAQMKDKVLLWVNDPIEAFFLEVQGSGRVQLPDGSLVRLGYADQNGQPYHSIGRWLIDQGELKSGEASMEGIKNWARAHPERLEELLDANPSFVFFRVLPRSDGGPLGALGLPLTPGRSLAVDPRILPLGAPVFLATTWPNDVKPLERLMLAQDTGGAIRGAVRADFFWGFGPEGGALAGRMKQKGRMWLLLPADYAPK
jgi:membrane-bound lytic murein transglycosylase A